MLGSGGHAAQVGPGRVRCVRWLRRWETPGSLGFPDTEGRLGDLEKITGSAAVEARRLAETDPLIAGA